MYLLPRIMDPKYLHFIIISSILWNTIDSDVHTSTGELIEIFRMEQELVISIIRLSFEIVFKNKLRIRLISFY